MDQSPHVSLSKDSLKNIRKVKLILPQRRDYQLQNPNWQSPNSGIVGTSTKVPYCFFEQGFPEKYKENKIDSPTEKRLPTQPKNPNVSPAQPSADKLSSS
ncbi:unnamed protein product [Lepeophtheirus salmonis]|uniref:(salmon louse) hypothetical protein n=1 Tax=Lepeophtheirus salmonis TaxID=72036 RepID=A0A817FBH9_LEPSM|nr:unnamed protein product [Lepeophtheirus salmonis]